MYIKHPYNNTKEIIYIIKDNSQNKNVWRHK